MVLVLQRGEIQQKLKGDEENLSSLGLSPSSSVFVYSDKVWKAQQTVGDSKASIESRKEAL